LGLSWFAGSDAPYIPTKQENLNKLFKLIEMKKGQKFYELGSGDGRVVLEAAKAGAEAVGVEQSWIRVLYSRWRAKKLELKNATFIHGNIFTISYQDADIVYIYLLQSAVDKLEEKLKKELKKRVLIITQKYHFKNWNYIRRYLDFQIYIKE